MISSGVTHTLVIPLDLVKCRLQVDPAKYQGVFRAFKLTVYEEGLRGLRKGWAPTLVGYLLQGLGKFGFYELFKLCISELLGAVSKLEHQTNYVYSVALVQERSYLWRTSLYLAASAIAKFFADIMLAPMEATKVRIQTQAGAPQELRTCAPMIWRTAGLTGFYKVSLWSQACVVSIELVAGHCAALGAPDPVNDHKICLLRAHGGAAVQARGAEAPRRLR